MRKHINPAMVLAFMALLLSLGGAAYAAKKAKKNTVVTKSIKKNAVTGAKIKPGAVSLEDISPDATGAFATAGAFDEKTNTLAVDPDPGTKVLSTTITLPAPKTVSAVATINGSGVGVGDSLFCTMNIAGEEGPLNGGVELNLVAQGYAMSINRSKLLPAGTHAVDVVCFEGPGDNSSVQNRNLSVVATG